MYDGSFKEPRTSTNKGDQTKADLSTVLNEKAIQGLSTYNPLTKEIFLNNPEDIFSVYQNREDKTYHKTFLLLWGSRRIGYTAYI